MKKLFIIIAVLTIHLTAVFSQTYIINEAEGQYSKHGPFEKRIEFNQLIPGGGFSSSSKGEIELKLFGKSNAFIEFFHLPSHAGASGFRVVKDNSGSTYLIEARYIANYEEIEEELSGKYPTIGITDRESVSKDSLQKKIAYNTAAINKHREARAERYDIESLTLPVSPQLAERLHEKMVSFIGDFKGKGVPPVIKGGHSVVFRNVVEDEVWSLRIKNPEGHLLKELCMQILKDAKANKLDELKYMAILNTINL